MHRGGDAMRVAMVVIALALAGAAGADLGRAGRLAIAWPGADGVARVAVVGVEDGSITVLAGSEGAVAPKWSPDGRYIVFFSTVTARTCLFDSKRNVVMKLGGALRPPYAWREDSLRFAGVGELPTGKQVVTQHSVSERGSVLDVGVPGRVRDIAWAAGTDDMAVLVDQDGRTNVYLVDAGILQRVSTSDDVMGLNLMANGRHVIWPRRSRNTRYIVTSLYDYNLEARSVRRTGFSAVVPGINGSPSAGPSAVPSVSVSPTDGSVCLAAVFDRSDAARKPTRVETIYLVSADGGQARSLRTRTLSAGDGSRVEWSTDGRFVLLTDLTGDRSVAARVYDAASGQERWRAPVAVR